MPLTSQPKTSQAPKSGTGRPGQSVADPISAARVDTSNLSPGAARRLEKLLTSIDRFTTAVQTKSLRLPGSK